MDNFNLKKYLNNNPLLNEIKVISPGTFSDKDIEELNILADESYGESFSEIERDYPIIETYYLENYESYPEDDYSNEKFIAIKHLLDNKPNGTYVLRELFDGISYEAPGAPANAFYTRITIDKNDQSVSVESPHIDENGDYYLGWFGKDKQYYPDIANFTEDGEYIGGAE